MHWRMSSQGLPFALPAGACFCGGLQADAGHVFTSAHAVALFGCPKGFVQQSRRRSPLQLWGINWSSLLEVTPMPTSLAEL